MAERRADRKPIKIWRNPVFIIILFGILVLAVYSGNQSSPVLDSAEYTVGERMYRVAIEKPYQTKYLQNRLIDQSFSLGQEVVIYEKKTNARRWREIKRYDFREVGPWCVAIGQMDDKEDIEVFVGAYRATRYYPDEPRPYLFSWDFENRKLLRLWTGSYLNAPVFLDAGFEDINGDGKEELWLDEIALDKGVKKHYRTHYIYHRNNFQPEQVMRKEK